MNQETLLIVRVNHDIDNFITQDVYQSYAFTQTVRVADTTYFAGVAPTTGDSKTIALVGDDMEAQLRFCLDVIDKLLAAERLNRSQLVSWTFYTTDAAALGPLMSSVVAEWVGADAPAQTMIEVSGFAIPDQLIEITPIAYRAGAAK